MPVEATWIKVKKRKQLPGNTGETPATLPSATLEPCGWHSRGYLPHFDGGAIPQMVTFRLAGTLPSVVLARWNQDLNYLSATHKKTALRRRLAAYLDQETKDTPLRNPQLRRWYRMPCSILLTHATICTHGL